MDLGEHTDQAFEGEPLGASVSKIGHAPLVDTEELRGDNGREVVYEPQYLVGELLAERGDRRFDGIAWHAPQSGPTWAITIIEV
jgi:hypothetical protein